LGDAFSFQFKPEGWFGRFLGGTLFVFLSMFIIPIPILVGYNLQVIKNVIDKKKDPLPHWTGVGKMWVDGVKFFFATLGYALPIILIVIIMIVMGILAAVYEDSEMAVITILLFLLLELVLMLYSLAMAFIAPILYIKRAQGATARELYHLGEIWSFIKKNIGNIIVVLLLGWASGLIVNFGMLFFFIGLFPAAFYAMTIIGHLYGQLALEDKAKK
ncbi:DUF4013 domain-containing protein, partial [Patescibacteria group bacterium]|nr:DUF4013 domain-containing protein [Patescibacteria group bacterium]